MGLIYKATNKINNKCYIGQTINKIDLRIAQHKCDANSNKYNMIFHKAIQKYGFDNFEWEVLAECNNNDLNEQEKYWIKYWNSNRINGYNMTDGGESHLKNYKHNQETKDKMSLSKIGNIYSLKKEIYTFYNTLTFEIFEGIVFDFYTKYNIHKSCAWRIANKKRKSHKNWTLIENKK